MSKEKKTPSLPEQIEKISSPDSVDPQWTDHINEVIKTFKALEPLGDFNLMDPESAKAAEKMFQAKLEELERLSHQVRTVKSFAEQQMPSDKKPQEKTEIQ